MASPTRAILFDFGGTLDHPHHWLDRFVRHYHAAGLRLSRAELDVAYSHATRTAYQAGDELHRHSLRELVRHLVAHQFDHLHRHGPDSVRGHLAGLGGERDNLADRIAAGFAEESAEGLARSRALLKELSHDFKLGVVSNFYGNLQVVLFEAGIRELIQVAIDSTQLGQRWPHAAQRAVAALPCARGVRAEQPRARLQQWQGGHLCEHGNRIRCNGEG